MGKRPLRAFPDRRAPTADSASIKSASHFIDLFLNFKCQWRRGRNFFAARERAKSGGHHQHKLGKNPFQLGGSFIFGPGEVDIFAHVSQNFGDNAPVSELLQSLS